MLMDEEMDHGPILDQMMMDISDENWPVPGPELDETLARMGGSLLAETIPAWLADELEPQEQNHEQASYCGKLTKEDSQLDIDPLQLPRGEAARHAWRTINAFIGIGDTFFIHNNTRVKIKKAEFADGQLRLLRVIPEGKSETDFAQYLQSIA